MALDDSVAVGTVVFTAGIRGYVPADCGATSKTVGPDDGGGHGWHCTTDSSTHTHSGYIGSHAEHATEDANILNRALIAPKAVALILRRA